eukprot:CAMPEP_0194499378 /NCGR_PEP_ID=MMETSP0253-20130528/15708_1 /TAXON_ID=2966 /ORGANISM="Noctiluca scintillans" /LENGTH=57 /DNA_ID=CAMNT_0039341125 /DNA_START=70 /DNA_END=240 /DNA_ORIENTATION=-
MRASMLPEYGGGAETEGGHFAAMTRCTCKRSLTTSTGTNRRQAAASAPIPAAKYPRK